MAWGRIRWNVLNEYPYVLVFRKISEGAITVDYKWVYKSTIMFWYLENFLKEASQ
jgi:hypothetical protein